MHVVFANPEPTLLVTDQLMTDRTLHIHHAHCSGVTALLKLRAHTPPKNPAHFAYAQPLRGMLFAFVAINLSTLDTNRQSDAIRQVV
jgi:hypothetical protein